MIIQYKIHCNTEDADKTWYLQNTDPTPTTCPTDSTHSVDLSSVVVVSNSAVFNTKTDGTLIVQPTTPVNSHTLQPLGLIKKSFDSSQGCAPITLSNQNGDTFNYTCALVPDGTYGYICANEFQNLVPIVSADTTAGTITVVSGLGSLLTNATCVLSNPVNIDYVLPTDLPIYELWGAFFQFAGNGIDDFAALQIVDTFGAITGAPGTPLLTYDTVWIQVLNKIGQLMTPDGTPGQVPGSCTIRVQYYNSLTTSTKVSAYMDAIITIFTA